MKEQRSVIRGGHDAKVTSLDAVAKLPTATIEDCVDLSKWQTIDPRTDKVLPSRRTSRVAAPLRRDGGEVAERLDGDRLRTGRGTHVLRRTEAAAMLLAGVPAPGIAYADDGHHTRHQPRLPGLAAFGDGVRLGHQRRWRPPGHRCSKSGSSAVPRAQPRGRGCAEDLLVLSFGSSCGSMVADGPHLGSGTQAPTRTH
ncbi:hypothetical protein [Streptomyces tauricus]|uniref:hypothetical protein n=1 Tax=Streptomyces tauricus TaxID=68274 RepID=UPI0022436F9E|nr:hypothetical protein [Streptomyces tauricus]MCW8095814.1 hypothetical protein [Streptomyces tauricus]